MDIFMFIVSGLLGGIASALLWAKGWEDVRKFEFVRSVILGAIGGFLYFLMHSEWNLPNSVVCFFFGYSFKDIIEGLAEKVKQKTLQQ